MNSQIKRISKIIYAKNARSILKTNFNEHSRLALTRLNVIQWIDIYEIEVYNAMYNYFNGNLLHSLSDIFPFT